MNTYGIAILGGIVLAATVIMLAVLYGTKLKRPPFYVVHPTIRHQDDPIRYDKEVSLMATRYKLLPGEWADIKSYNEFDGPSLDENIIHLFVPSQGDYSRVKEAALQAYYDNRST